MISDLREALLEAADEPSEAVEENEVVDEKPEVSEGEAEQEAAVEEPTLEDASGEADAEIEAVPSSKNYNVEKAPSGWTPENREMWADVPPNLKQQIMKRDHEVEDLFRNTAEARRSFKQFNETIDPFRSVIAAHNAQPMEAIQGLLQTATALQMGTPQQKAQRISQLINHYGIDINTLDTILSGQQPENAPDDAMQQAIDARMQPMENFFNDMQNRQYDHQLQSDQQVQDDIGVFETKAEFFEDVRLDMADLMDFATQRGQDMSLQQAYDKACSLHPEISRVMTQRKSQTDLGIKKQVSNGSLRTSLGGVPDSSGGLELRAQLESLWDGEDG